MCKTKGRVIRLAGELGSIDDLQIQLLSSNLNIDAHAQARTQNLLGRRIMSQPGLQRRPYLETDTHWVGWGGQLFFTIRYLKTVRCSQAD